MEELKHFLEVEMRITEERQKNGTHGVFNGVAVGHGEAKELLRKHYSFCKRLLDMVNKEDK